MGENLSDAGEFEAIRRVIRQLPLNDEVLIGPGDDAASVRIDGAEVLVASDMLIEGRHFDLAFSTPADVGFKAMMVNLSDIAAMGGRPLHATVSLGAPGVTSMQTIESFAGGIAEAARMHGVAVVGGDTVSSDVIVVAITVVGAPGSTPPVTRAAARAGDVVAVTGELGAAAAGLALLREASADPHAASLLERLPALADAHRRARARVAEGQALAAAGARAMIDVSDGLVADLSHVAQASGVHIEIARARVPVAAGVAEVEAWLGAADLALRGGDDYELAIACSPDRIEACALAIAPVALTAVGRCVAGAGVTMDGEVLDAGGWDHFRGEA